MKKLVVAIIALVGLVSCGEQEKIVFVDRTELLKEYQGRKDIETKYKDKFEKLDIKKDSVSKALQIEAKDFQDQAKSMSQAKAQEKYNGLMQKQQYWTEQFQNQEYMIGQDSQKEIDTLLKKVKKFIGTYGKEHKYTYILGSNDAGSVMYGEESKDITEDVLKALNDEYARN